ncbi:MAG TPA: alpha/beta hydrolase-fold protein [Saprospiraceae bacterium]|nr:alpha/beta hydrolase-fold protein [Saprospiraceae bacterium]
MNRNQLWLSFILNFFIVASLSAQLTINVTSVPADTPDSSNIFIAGNFNSWNPGNPAHQLIDNQNGTYSITFNPSPGTLEFKFTRGSWDTVEGTAGGGFIPNRTYSYSGAASTVNLTIAGWEDVSGLHTATDNVQILDEDYFIPQLNRTRRIWIYLPPDYNTTSKHYPVLYMHDGQNLFDAFYSFAGEWKIDESMNNLFNAGDYGAIVVGIDNGEGERFDEYSPWYSPNYNAGGDGEAYVSFLVNTLKPHIDSTFRTLPGRDYTAIAGSSLGGLISMYGAAEYPDVFGKAGIFSPAFQVSDSCFLQVMSKTFDEDIRVYFVAGHNESSGMIPDILNMQQILLKQGVDSSNIKVVDELDGVHNEGFWAREYPDAYEWLFENLVLKTNIGEEKKINVFPNPSSDFLYLDSPSANFTFEVYTLTGVKMLHGQGTDQRIDIASLPGGMYLLQINDQEGEVMNVRFIKT